MQRQEAIEKIRELLPQYVETITEPSRRAGRGMYECPLCGSGTGQNRHSTGAFSITKDGLKWRCFSCNESGDIYDLIGKIENIADFNEQFKRACDIFNISVVNDTYITSDTMYTKTTKKETSPAPEVKHDYSDYIDACKMLVNKTDYFKSRGISDDIIKRFNLGYDIEKKAVVIPYNKQSNYYITRSIEQKRYYKPSSDIAGLEPLYNKQALYINEPVFICEGTFDALSIIEAGGNAVAINGAKSGINKVIQACKEKMPVNMLILCLDQDQAGQEGIEALEAELNKLSVKNCRATFNLEEYKDHKDANEMLLSNKEQFIKDVQENIEEAKRLFNAEKQEAIEKYSAISGSNRLTAFIYDINNQKNKPFIPTGFKNLDAELDGGLYAGLYILGAISSLGKTTLALQVADNIATAGHDVLIFSLEMASSELIAKSVSRNTYILSNKNANISKTNRGITVATRYENYSPEERQLINKALGAYNSYAGHVYIVEGLGDVGAKEIRQQVAEHIKLTGNTPVVIIDYLQILAPYNDRGTDKQNTDKAVLELKRLSRDYKTPVLGISSFNRDNYTQAVNMASFKESGAIEYGSDVLIALQPEQMEDGKTDTEKAKNKKKLDECKASPERNIEAVILKNRNGRTGGKIAFKYVAMFNYFEEINGVRSTRSLSL